MGFSDNPAAYQDDPALYPGGFLLTSHGQKPRRILAIHPLSGRYTPKVRPDEAGIGYVYFLCVCSLGPGHRPLRSPRDAGAKPVDGWNYFIDRMINPKSHELGGHFSNPSGILQDLPIVPLVIEAYSEAYSAVQCCNGCPLPATLHTTAYAVYLYV